VTIYLYRVSFTLIYDDYICFVAAKTEEEAIKKAEEEFNDWHISVYAYKMDEVDGYKIVLQK
ncbi:MAG: hypothetical protein ACYDG6_14540, partial [Thermincolia bacterium]